MNAKRILAAVLSVLALVSVTSCAKRDDDAPQGAGRHPAQTSTEQPTSEPSGADTASPSGEVRLTFAATGDNIVHESLYLQAAANAAAAGSGSDSRDYYFDPMYDDAVRELISSADISFVNQEGPISGLSPSGYPNFNAPREAGDALVRLGFDIVNIANNHMCDMEHLTTGYQNSIEYWDSKDVTLIGGYKNDRDFAPRYIERDGIKIALLSFTYGTNGYSVNSSSAAVVPYIDDSKIKSQIEEAKASAELVFVSMHWGEENSQATTAEQKRLAEMIADCGADVVIGHHSHTVQPIEWLERTDHRTLVIYSLGNFISSQLYMKNLVGEIVTFDIVKGVGDERAHIENVVSNPTVTHYLADASQLDSQDLERRYDLHVYLMKDYNESLCNAHGAHTWDSFTLADVRAYITRTIASEFLPDYLK